MHRNTHTARLAGYAKRQRRQAMNTLRGEREGQAGMSKDEARAFLKNDMGWSDRQINNALEFAE